MSGIAGTVRFDGVECDRNLLKRQLALLAGNRRVDESQSTAHEWAYGAVAIGATGLSSNDRHALPAAELLTSASDNAHVLAIDGELAVGQGTATAPSDLPFARASDGERLLGRLAQQGVHAFARTTGSFAFAWFERRTRRVWLVRDPMGLRPLYYHRNDRRLVFASDIRAILADPDTPRHANHVALQRIMLFGCSPDPYTAFEGIHRVAPAHALRVEPDGRCIPAAYWSVDDLPLSDEVGLLALLQARATLGSDDTSRPSVIADGSAGAELLRAVAGDDVRDTPESDAPWRPTSIEQLVSIFEEPTGDASSPALHAAVQVASDGGASGVLSALGSDELFGLQSSSRWRRYLTAARTHGEAFARAIGRSPEHQARSFSTSVRAPRTPDVRPLIVEAADGWGLIADETVSRAWLDLRAFGSLAEPFELLLNRWTGRSMRQQRALLALHTTLSAGKVIEMGRLARWGNIRIGTPFLTPEVIARALRANDDVRWGQLRYGKTSMPTALGGTRSVAATKSRDVEGAVVIRLRGDEVRELLLGWRTLQRGVVDVRRVEDRLRGLRRGDSAAASQLFRMAALEQWFRLFIDAPAAEVAA